MTVNIKEISQHIEKIAPLNIAESWDNCGWQIYCGDKPVDKALVVLSVTNEAIDKAINENFDVIISHHPVIFSEIKNVTPNNLTGRIILKAIRAGISIYSAHTNLDKINNGVSDLIANKLDLVDVMPIVPDKFNPDIGMGRSGKLKKSIKINFLLDKVKQILEIDKLKVINYSEESEIKKIAICGGSGSSLINNLQDDVDVFITGDIKYHDALEALDFIMIDADHCHTEKFIVDELVNYLKQLDIEVECIRADNPWEIH